MSKNNTKPATKSRSHRDGFQCERKPRRSVSGFRSLDRGLTLLELIVAVTLLLIIITSFSFLIKGGISSAAKAKELAQKINKVQSKMEETRSLSFTQLQNLNDPEVQARLISSDLLEIKVGDVYTFRSKY